MDDKSEKHREDEEDDDDEEDSFFSAKMRPLGSATRPSRMI